MSSGSRDRIILGLESGGEHLSAALLDGDGTVLGEACAHRGDKHSDLLLSLTSELLARAGLKVSDLALIAVGRGPGSFTGIRVALSLAEGLGLAAGVPIWPVSSLAAHALNAVVPDTIAVPLFDAKRGEVYAAAYRLCAHAPPITLLAPRVGPCEAALVRAREVVGGERMVVLGSGALAYGVASPLPAAAHVPSATATAELAFLEWRAAGFDAGLAPAVDAVYLRKSEAELMLEARVRAGGE